MLLLVGLAAARVDRTIRTDKVGESDGLHGATDAAYSADAAMKGWRDGRREDDEMAVDQGRLESTRHVVF